jgi:aspartate/methionine/tyrosine aminotransferase
VGALSGLPSVGGSDVERWFARQGAPPRLDLARSGAAPLTVGEVLALGGDVALEELVTLSLDYGDGRGDERLRHAIAAAGSARDASEVLVTHGAAEALLLVSAAAAGGGGEAVVAAPAYGALSAAPRAVGLRVRQATAWVPGLTRLCLDAVAAAAGAGTRIVLVNSPHNPSGASATLDDIEALARRCATNGALLVVDEVSRGTSCPGASSATLCPAYAEGLVAVCGDVSKSLGLGGLRVGWLASADTSLLARAAALKDLTSIANARPTQLLAAIALEHREVIAGRTAVWARLNSAAVSDLVARCAGQWSAPVDGLVVFPRLPLGDASDRFAQRLHARAGVAVVPGSLFGAPDRLRLGLGCKPAEFAEGADRLAEAIGA